ncbi:hypothetical protein FACS1894110_20350 [Spirochaetia bacterium]|nr:hypothetical protein FACS1894110_20350 [Spirochaetia bacterium]
MKRITAALFIGLGLAALSTVQAQQAPDGAGFVQEGIASWYGTEFNGRPTASGELFNAALFTAAHPTLPFGTTLTVTNRQNNRKVTVRVNDRGPFVSARIIDLSRAAAEQLDMLATGTAPVLVEGVMAPANPAPSPQYTGTNSQTAAEGSRASASAQIVTQSPPIYSEPILIQPVLPQPPVRQVQPVEQYQPVPPVQQPQQPVQPPQPVQQYQPVQPVQNITPPTVPANKVFRIQVGSYRVARNAVETFDKLKAAGLNPVYERSGEYFRVVLSGIRSDDVDSVIRRIGAAGFRDPLIREE